MTKLICGSRCQADVATNNDQMGMWVPLLASSSFPILSRHDQSNPGSQLQLARRRRPSGPACCHPTPPPWRLLLGMCAPPFWALPRPSTWCDLAAANLRAHAPTASLSFGWIPPPPSPRRVRPTVALSLVSRRLRLARTGADGQHERRRSSFPWRTAYFCAARPRTLAVHRLLFDHCALLSVMGARLHRPPINKDGCIIWLNTGCISGQWKF
jgi:hypothetical protein